METPAAFHIGERIVYPLHGMGHVAAVCRRLVDDQPQDYYRLVLEGKTRGEVLVPLHAAQALGLRPVLQAAQVAQVLHRVHQTATQPVTRGHRHQHYTWCKACLRRGNGLGLAEVWRFVHDLEHVERIIPVPFQQLRAYVRKQLPAELAVALACTEAEAAHVLALALPSEGEERHNTPPVSAARGRTWR